MASIGRYEIISELGRGGMAAVYHARDPHFDREVAVKVLPPEFLHDPTFRSRFEREAQAIAALEHPAIVPVYDFGEDEGQPYLVMRYMPGGTLGERIQKGRMPLNETASIIAQLAPGLDIAHQQGIIHRDLKPGNILFDAYGNAFLSDFGIVRLSEATAQLTGTGILGTPAYIAPEMADPDGLSYLVDIYALGVMTYEMLTGRVPFQAETPVGTMMAHISKPVPDIRSANPDLPPHTKYVIDTVLAKDPAKRYQSAAAFSGDLSALARDGALPGVEFAAPDAEGPTIIEPYPAPGIPAQTDRIAPPQEARALEAAVQAPQKKRGSRLPLLVIGCGGSLGLMMIVGIGLLGWGAASGLLIAGPARTETAQAEADRATRIARQNATATAQQREANRETAIAEVNATATAASQATRTAQAVATADIQTQQAALVATVDNLPKNANVPSSWALVVSDDFNSSSGLWPLDSTDNDLATVEREIEGGVYRFTLTAKDNFVTLNWPDIDDDVFTDFAATTMVRQVAGPRTARIGLLMRHNDIDNFYTYMISREERAYIARQIDDEWLTTEEVRLTGALTERWNRLTVVARGASFEFYVNGTLAFDLSDSNLIDGRAGVTVELLNAGDEAVVEFSDFAIFAP